MVDLDEEVVTTDDEDEEAEPLPHYHYGVRLPRRSNSDDSAIAAPAHDRRYVRSRDLLQPRYPNRQYLRSSAPPEEEPEEEPRGTFEKVHDPDEPRIEEPIVTPRKVGVPLSRYFLGPLYEGRLPNALTFARVCAIPVLALAFLVPSLSWLTTTLFALTSFTDWLDGYLARKWQVPPPTPWMRHHSPGWMSWAWASVMR